MKQTVAIGIQDFEKIIERDVFYIDKTSLIREWWNNRDDVTLITRPRRFGKTLNLSMMNCFFSNRYAGRGDLFSGLEIWEEASFRELQGTFPVICLSFAKVKQSSYDQARKSLNQMLENLYNEYEDLLADKMFSEADRRFFHQVKTDMDDATAADAVNRLSGWLCRYYNKKVLIFLDEYDTPLQEAYLHGYWDELVAYIRAFFNSTFKSNPYLDRALMTGITRISRESIFSDLNNLDAVTTTSAKYAACFGFTENEVFRSLEAQGFGEKEKEEVKAWYDGFTFGPVTDIYNPWSVINYLEKRELDTYWANTSSNSLISTLISRGSPALKEKFETLLNGESVTVPVDEQIVFNQLDRRENAIWSLLLASGYLRVVSVHRESYENSDRNADPLYTLTLTNREVRKMFSGMVMDWFAQDSSFHEFIRCMLRGDVRGMNRYMNKVALNTFSYFDTGRQAGVSEPEKFYHGFVLGLLVDRLGTYRIKSNRESGYGRYDVVLEPQNPDDPAVIMEFKVFDPEDTEVSLKDTAENALKQIEEKRYDTELLDRGIPAGRILKYGLAFQGKQCLILKGNDGVCGTGR